MTYFNRYNQIAIYFRVYLNGRAPALKGTGGIMTVSIAIQQPTGHKPLQFFVYRCSNGFVVY